MVVRVGGDESQQQQEGNNVSFPGSGPAYRVNSKLLPQAAAKKESFSAGFH
jgi:hypothetical protein